ncbi:hypothetical protein DY000_02049297 [Brassica cretica]|uniref:Uncharacterized protein n=1 Tax=Brassica cretica TaxID=69181 RepID=A0ABQ7EZX4_BRACR|nr:hypothetical protein DY000_02049297 [Brassica cretica]
MFYGVCGEHEKNKEAFQMKLDGVYYPLNDSISRLTTCMEEMKQDIARIQHATDVARPPSIDRRRPPSIDRHHHTSIDNHMSASIDNKERLNGRCDDIYFPMDLSIGALTSKIEAIQRELVEIQSYIARRPEASLSIDRRNNISTENHHRTSVDVATNRGQLVPKMTSDMSDTHYHGEEISADTYATLRRHQFNQDNLEERLQRMENTTVIMKEKWCRGDEAMRDFTDSSKDSFIVYQKAIDGRTLHVSREDIADILQTANRADNLFMHHRNNPEQKATNEFYDTAGGIDNIFIQKSRHPTQTSIDIVVPTSVAKQPEFGRRAYDRYGSRKFYWEEKDEYGVYRDDRRYARDLDGNTIRLHNRDIRRLLERASRDEPSYICLLEHANLFTQTKLVPEIYTKDEINEMFYGVCGEHEKNKGAFQMKLDGVYYPLNDIINWLTTCMEEMKQDIARIQHATDVA